MNHLRWLLTLLALSPLLALAGGPLAEEQVPEPLKPWVEWVLDDKDERACPHLYNAPIRRCAWPSRLKLELTDGQGSFTQTWQVYRESWAPLPGDAKLWPQQVRVDGLDAAVVVRDGRPAVRLSAGAHRIGGEWNWDRLPDALVIPPDTGLVDLTVNGNTVEVPNREDPGRLWLVERGADPKAGVVVGDVLELHVFRRVVDDNPMRVLTLIQLTVSGRQREVVLGPPLLDGFVPVSLRGELPARLEADGRLRVQLRPGTWALELDARHPEYLEQLSWQGDESPWPDAEIWVFEARNAIRLVEVEGVTPVDPRQTGLPGDWSRLPAYRLQPGDRMILKVLRRGDPEPEPSRLTLQRNLWLDFDGGGYTVQDRITGTMTSGWRLQTAPGLELGRALIDGQPRFITRLEGSDRPGVEVRRGVINLVADLRYQGDVGSLPAGGWDHDFQQAAAMLHLPPGWKLFSAFGIDNVPGTWLQQWTLLDLFLVLIAAIAVARLWRWHWGLLALVTLGLIWHEPDAPRYVWLNIVAAIALLRVLPPGRFRNALAWYRNLSLLALVVISVPFMISEVRLGLYPQLERPWLAVGNNQALISAVPVAPQVVGQMAGSVVDAVRPRSSKKEAPARKSAPAPASLMEYRQAVLQMEPNAKLQTGPGLPLWQWKSVQLGWNGPVDKGQRVGLVLLPPWANLLLNLLRVLLLLGLAWRFLDLQALKPKTGTLPVAMLMLGTTPLLLGLPDRALADFPGTELLQQLETRLLTPPDCLPACADISNMALELGSDYLLIDLQVHAEQQTAIPLPGNREIWRPSRVQIGEGVSESLFTDPKGNLWIMVPQGRQRVVLAGALRSNGSVQLELPLKPRRASVQGDGWQVEGIGENGVPQGQLKLTRVRPEIAPDTPEALVPGVLPPFLRIERVLRLGLDWQVETRVSRLSPTGSPLVARVPLLPEERVLSAGVQRSGAHVLVAMAPDQIRATWSSALDIVSELELTAMDRPGLTEVWQADISPIWHAEISGLAPVHYQDAHRRWLPEWRPWPSERVRFSISRPRGVEGQSLTLDSSRLLVAPGKRATDVSLEMSLRSSQGGQHDILLPKGAELQSVTIDGKAQPIRQEGAKVTLPVIPGSQTFALAWRQQTGIGSFFSTPSVDLGLASVNNSLKVVLGQDRWVLWTSGPRLGPAVLFWGVLLVIALIALGLGRVRMTPLRARHWLLLGIGLSQAPVWVGITVVGWLLALGWRGRPEVELPRGGFNLIQVGLALLTLAALVQLFEAVRLGLLGTPEMQIAGNRSNAYDLNWYQDRIDPELPQASVLSVSLLVYRSLMLAWALWLAFALVGWLRWGWRCFSSQGLWRAVHLEVPYRRCSRKKPTVRQETDVEQGKGG